MESIWTCKTMTFINHSRLQLQIMSCSLTHGIVTISHINSLCYMCTIIYLYLYKEWCHNTQARFFCFVFFFLKREQVLPPDGPTYSTASPNTLCFTMQSIRAARKKVKWMEKEMNILRTKCFPSLLDFFLFQGKCKIK